MELELVSQCTGYQILKMVQDIVVNEGMLTRSQIATGKFRVSTKRARSRAGIKGNIPWMSINLGGSVKSAEDLPQLQRWEASFRVECSGKASLRRARQAVMSGSYVFIEYSSFAHDPEIGNFICNDPKEAAAVLIAHEMAHCVNYCSGNPRFKGRNHDHNFRRVYSIIRKATLSAMGSTPLPAVEVQQPPQRLAASAASAPRRAGAVRTVWEVCSQYPTFARSTLIETLVTDYGINRNTAATQYAKWNKAGRPTNI